MHSRSSSSSPILRAAIAALLGSVLIIPALATADEDTELEEVVVTGSRISRPDYVSPNPVQSVTADAMDKLGIVSVSEAISQIPSNVSAFQPGNTGTGSFFVGSTLANLRGLNPYFGTRTLTLVDSRRFVPSNQGGSVDLGMIPSTLIQRMDVVTGGASAAYGSDAVSGVVNVILDKRLQGVKLEADYGLTGRGDGQNHHISLGAGTAFAGGKGHIVFGGELQKSDAINDCAGARSWCGAGNGTLLNWGTGAETTGTAMTPGSTQLVPGGPQYLIVSGRTINQSSANGVIFDGVAGDQYAYQSNAAGTAAAQDFAIGQFGTLSPNQTTIGGDGDPVNQGITLYPQVDRKIAYSHLDWDFTDHLSGYAEGSFGQVKGVSWQEVANASQYCLSQDNPYLQQVFGGAIPAGVLGNGAASSQCMTPFFTPDLTEAVVRKDWNDQREGYVATDTKTYRGVLGLKGSYADTWTWDAYYQFGETKRSQVVNDSLSQKRMAMAVDAVTDPNTGDVVCRVNSSLNPYGVGNGGLYTAPIPGDPTYDAYTLLAQGCQPLNVFGQSASPQALNYVLGNLTEYDTIKQNVVEVSTSGQLWGGWGYGPLSAAVGANFRQEKLSNDVGHPSVAEAGTDDELLREAYAGTDFAYQFGDAFAGKTTVWEAFAELEMPLLADLPGVKKLTLNGAARHTSYKTVDELYSYNPASKIDVTTWKLATVWDVVDWLRLRGSYSRDLRAPGFRELFYSQSMPQDAPGAFTFFGGGVNPWKQAADPSNPGGVFAWYDPYAVNYTGNTELTPEKASTTTVGFVLTPQGPLQGLQFAVDYYKLKLNGSIRSGNPTEALNYCYQGINEFCQYIDGVRDDSLATVPGGEGFSDITSIRAPYRNGDPYRASGLDISSTYLLPLARLFDAVPGTVSFSLNATRAIHATVQRYVYPSGYVSVDLAGQSGGNGFLSDFSSMPKWVGNFNFSYMNGPFTGTIGVNYTGKGMLNLETPYIGPDDPAYDPGLAGSITKNTIGSVTLFSLNGSYNLPMPGIEQTQLFVSVDNLFDRDPPFSNVNGGVGGVNALYFNTMGRTFRFGVRMKL